MGKLGGGGHILTFETKIYDNVLSPLPMQNPYSKFILAIKTLILDRFSKNLQVLLRQIEIQMLSRKYFPCLAAVKKYRQKIIVSLNFTH